MPECGNCGAQVSAAYVRVFSLPDRDTVRCCPLCPDRIREGAAVREAKAPRGERARRNESKEGQTT